MSYNFSFIISQLPAFSCQVTSQQTRIGCSVYSRLVSVLIEIVIWLSSHRYHTIGNSVEDVGLEMRCCCAVRHQGRLQPVAGPGQCQEAWGHLRRYSCQAAEVQRPEGHGYSAAAGEVVEGAAEQGQWEVLHYQYPSEGDRDLARHHHCAPARAGHLWAWQPIAGWPGDVAEDPAEGISGT